MQQIPLVAIPLTQGLVAIIDAQDLLLVSKHKWYAARNYRTFYALTHVRVEGKRRSLTMHQLIAGNFTDHKNGNGLDNRRSNLRPASNAQNQGNQRKARNNTSGFKGVSWDSGRKKWAASIRAKVKHRLGCFADPKEAALAYDSAARLHFGEFAALNFPRPGERAA